MSKRNEQTPLHIRVVSGQRDITFNYDSAARMLTLQGEQIALGTNNLVLCDISDDNTLIHGSISLVATTFEAALWGREAEAELLRVPAVRDFLAGIL